MPEPDPLLQRLPATLVQADELTTGLESLKRLIADVGHISTSRNEAGARFQIIDRILVECLGYPRHLINCEMYENGEYSDYQISSPIISIWEAKREGVIFEIPETLSKNSVQRISSLAAMSPELKNAIDQVNGYCLDRGCDLAVVTNGHQIVAFIPATFDNGYSGNAFVIRSLAHFESSFGRAWQLLSYPGVLSRNLQDFLARSLMSQPPEKMSFYIPNYPQFKDRTELQSSLKTVADLLLLDIEKQQVLEATFYEECYVESGGLSQNSTISKSILAARYASLFGEGDPGVDMQPVKASRNKDLFTPDLLAEAISSKPIILLGDVGVGKSSFIKHLKYVSAYDEFRRAIYVYVDLAFRGALQTSLRDVVLRAVEETLLDEHNIDVLEDSFVRRIYKKELDRFERGVDGRIKDTDPIAYMRAEIDHIKNLIRDRAEHLKRSVQYLSSERRKQVIIAIDNADKRSSDLQQEAFIIAQNIASTWKAAVFVSMRPSTYYTSKRAGVLSAYQNRIFTISPPRIDLVLEKRLSFALEIAEGKRQLEELQHVRLNLSSIVAILNVIIPSIVKNDDIQIFLENITAGNVRAVIEFLAEVIGSPNIDTEGVIRGLAENGEYSIPIHDFWKVALKGEYNYFDPSRAIASNVFDTYSNDKSEHFLAPIMIAYLASEGAHRASEGFVATSALLSETQSLGFSIRSCERCLRRLVNDGLIETSLRISFEEDEFGHFGELPDKVRANSRGAYYLNRWMTTFSYLDAVAVDMQIFDLVAKEDLKDTIRLLSLKDRTERALRVRAYLSETWAGLGLKLGYFDWEQQCSAQNWSFDRVRLALSKAALR